MNSKHINDINTGYYHDINVDLWPKCTHYIYIDVLTNYQVLEICVIRMENYICMVHSCIN